MNNVRAKFGELVARTVRDRLAVEYEITSAQHTAERIEEDAKLRAEQIGTETNDLVAPMRAELCEILGVPPTTDKWKLQSEVKRIRREIAEHPAHAALKTLTSVLERALSQFGYKKAQEDDEEVAC